jgi:hypothetical protein
MKNIHYIQIVDNRDTLTPLRKKCMASLKDKIRPEDTYEVITVEYDPDPRKMIRLVDSIKLSKAMEILNLCVVDTDCFVSKPLHELNIVEDTPYFGMYDFNDQNSMPDIFYFFVNDCPYYFRRFLNPDVIKNEGGYSVNIQSLRALKDFEYIPDDTYLHTYETMSEVVIQQKMADLAKTFESDRMELVMLRKSVEQMAMVMKTYENLRKVNHRG